MFTCMREYHNHPLLLANRRLDAIRRAELINRL